MHHRGNRMLCYHVKLHCTPSHPGAISLRSVGDDVHIRSLGHHATRSIGHLCFHATWSSTAGYNSVEGIRVSLRHNRPRETSFRRQLRKLARENPITSMTIMVRGAAERYKSLILLHSCAMDAIAGLPHCASASSSYQNNQTTQFTRTYRNLALPSFISTTALLASFIERSSIHGCMFLSAANCSISLMSAVEPIIEPPNRLRPAMRLKACTGIMPSSGAPTCTSDPSCFRREK